MANLLFSRPDDELMGQNTVGGAPLDPKKDIINALCSSILANDARQTTHLAQNSDDSRAQAAHQRTLSWSISYALRMLSLRHSQAPTGNTLVGRRKLEDTIGDLSDLISQSRMGILSGDRGLLSRSAEFGGLASKLLQLELSDSETVGVSATLSLLKRFA